MPNYHTQAKERALFLNEKATRRLLKKVRQRHNHDPLAIADQLDGDKARKCAFLSAYSECGNIALSCRACGLAGGAVVKHWLKNDRGFKKLYKQAEEYAIANLEHEAHRRAVHGTTKLVTYKGQPVYVPEDLFDPQSKLVPLLEKQYSDDLLKLLLRARLPHKYGSQLDLTSKGDAISYKTLKGVSADEL